MDNKKERGLLSSHLSNSWMWGTPKGLSDRPEEFLQFLEENKDFKLIPVTQVIWIGDIDEETAEKLVSFLRNDPQVLK